MVSTIIMVSLGILLWLIIFAVLLHLTITSEHALIFGCVLMTYFVTSLVTACYLFGDQVSGDGNVLIMPYITMLH